MPILGVKKKPDTPVSGFCTQSGNRTFLVNSCKSAI